jgi:hypothetical protein
LTLGYGRFFGEQIALEHFAGSTHVLIGSIPDTHVDFAKRPQPTAEILLLWSHQQGIRGIFQR